MEKPGFDIVDETVQNIKTMHKQAPAPMKLRVETISPTGDLGVERVNAGTPFWREQIEDAGRIIVGVLDGGPAKYRISPQDRSARLRELGITFATEGGKTVIVVEPDSEVGRRRAAAKAEVEHSRKNRPTTRAAAQAAEQFQTMLHNVARPETPGVDVASLQRRIDELEKAAKTRKQKADAAPND